MAMKAEHVLICSLCGGGGRAGGVPCFVCRVPPRLSVIQGGKSQMNDLRSLELQHRELERQLAEAVEHLSTSDAELAAIKRDKLRVKDEIVRLRNQEIVCL